MLQSNLQYTQVSTSLDVLFEQSCEKPNGMSNFVSTIAADVINDEGVCLYTDGAGLIAYYNARKEFYGRVLQGAAPDSSYTARAKALAEYFTEERFYRFWEIQSFVKNMK